MLVKVAQTQLKIDSPAFKELANSVLQASRTQSHYFCFEWWNSSQKSHLLSHSLSSHCFVWYVDDACAGGVYGSGKSAVGESLEK